MYNTYSSSTTAATVCVRQRPLSTFGSVFISHYSWQYYVNGLSLLKNSFTFLCTYTCSVMLALVDSKSEFTVKISVCLLELLSYINFEVAVTAVSGIYIWILLRHQTRWERWATIQQLSMFLPIRHLFLQASSSSLCIV